MTPAAVQAGGGALPTAAPAPQQHLREQLDLGGGGLERLHLALLPAKHQNCWQRRHAQPAPQRLVLICTQPTRQQRSAQGQPLRPPRHQPGGQRTRCQGRAAQRTAHRSRRSATARWGPPRPGQSAAAAAPCSRCTRAHRTAGGREGAGGRAPPLGDDAYAQAHCSSRAALRASRRARRAAAVWQGPLAPHLHHHQPVLVLMQLVHQLLDAVHLRHGVRLGLPPPAGRLAARQQGTRRGRGALPACKAAGGAGGEWAAAACGPALVLGEPISPNRAPCRCAAPWVASRTSLGVGL